MFVPPRQDMDSSRHRNIEPRFIDSQRNVTEMKDSGFPGQKGGWGFVMISKNNRQDRQTQVGTYLSTDRVANVTAARAASLLSDLVPYDIGLCGADALPPAVAMVK
jgi:hypothetical protein